MYTEEEAKTKWCPFVRFVRLRDAIYSSRGPIVEPGSPTADESLMNCLGSVCTAWRWKMRFGTSPDNSEECAVLPSTHGYCGLAGRPE